MKNYKNEFIKNNTVFLESLHSHLLEENILWEYDKCSPMGRMDRKGRRPKMPIKNSIMGNKFEINYNSSLLSISFKIHTYNITLNLNRYSKNMNIDKIYTFSGFCDSLNDIEIEKKIKKYQDIPVILWKLSDDHVYVNINEISDTRRYITGLSFFYDSPANSYCKGDTKNPYLFFTTLAYLPEEYKEEVYEFLFNGLSNTSFLDCINLISDKEIKVDKQFLIDIKNLKIEKNTNKIKVSN